MVCTLLVALLLATSFSLLTAIPKFVFAALMLHTAAKLMYTSFVRTLPTLDWSESIVVVIIVGVSFVNMTTGLALGGAASALLFVYGTCVSHHPWNPSISHPRTHRVFGSPYISFCDDNS